MHVKKHAGHLLLALLICCSAIVSCKKDIAPVPEKIKLKQERMNITSGILENLGMDLWYSLNGPPYILVSCNYTGNANLLDVAINYSGQTQYGVMWPNGSNTSAYFQLSTGQIPTSRYTVTVQVDDNQGNVATTNISVSPPPGGVGTPLKGSLSEMKGTQMREQWSNINRHYFRFSWVYNPSNYVYREETVYIGMKFYDSQGYYVGAVTGSGQTNSVSFTEVNIPAEIVGEATYVKILAGSSYSEINPYDYNERWENLQLLTPVSFSNYDQNNVGLTFRDKTIPVN
jgi:hypothetical protein